LKPGDLVLIPFPQADLQPGKLRPALVIAVAPGRHADILLALVTSRVHQAVPQFDEVLTPADADFPATKLKTASVVRLARLAAVDPSVIRAKLGAIDPDRLTKIRGRLSEWLKD
jgi:mRNA interferase MazF